MTPRVEVYTHLRKDGGEGGHRESQLPLEHPRTEVDQVLSLVDPDTSTPLLLRRLYPWSSGGGVERTQT